MSRWDAEISALQQGKTVVFRPTGHSMAPFIKSGALVTVEPVGTTPLTVGQVVLCKIGGKSYLHWIKMVGKDGRFMIGNSKGKLNGWTKSDQIYGIVTKVSE